MPKIDFSEYDNKNFDGSFSELFSILEKLASKNKVLILTNNRVEKQILLKERIVEDLIKKGYGVTKNEYYNNSNTLYISISW